MTVPWPRTTDTYADWQEVYADNVAGVYRLVYARLGNRADAEDLTAEVFLATLKPLRLPAPVHDVRAYLVATARTAMANFWRRHYAGPATVMLTDMAAETSEHSEGDGGAARTATILSRLSDRSRTILELRFLRGYSIREAADEMAVSVSNAKILQYRALRQAACVGAEVEREAEPSEAARGVVA